jgi:DNA-directed RNA polymerase subunit RPC12/RpoP
MSGKYSVEYVCLNCNERFHQSFDYGKPVEEKVLCKRCGCVKAEKLWSTTLGAAPRERVVIREVQTLVINAPPTADYQPTPNEPLKVWCGKVSDLGGMQSRLDCTGNPPKTFGMGICQS